MGKTKKKNTGSPKHHKEPKHVAGPQTLERIDPLVTCPYCVRAFRLSETGYSDSRTLCPHCKETIDEKDYDRRLQEIKDECPSLIEAGDVALKRRDKLAVAQFKTKFELLKRWYGWRIRRLNERNADLFATADEARRKMSMVPTFAYSRYYTSLWFALTGKPLERESEGPLSGYRMRSMYSDDGEYALRVTDRTDSMAHGIRAEYLVFNALVDKTMQNGPLKKARVCPNLYITNESADEMEHGVSGSWSGSRYGSMRVRGSLKPLFSQTDCLLLTKWAVYVIEVKSRHTHIRVDSDGHVFAPAREGGSSPARSFDADVRQCANHASAFATAFPDIPFERIFELTVYVEPLSFESERLEVADNAYVCSCGAGTGAEEVGDVIEEIDTCLHGKKPLFSQKDPYRMSGKILGSYGDSNGRKEYIHLERLETLRYFSRD